MDWLADFWSKLVSWWDQLASSVYNGVIAWLNDLVDIWNGWMHALMHPSSVIPSSPDLRYVVGWLANLVDYVSLMYMLVDYVAYAQVVQQLLTAQLSLVMVGLGFRAFLVIRRIVLVS